MTMNARRIISAGLALVAMLYFFSVPLQTSASITTVPAAPTYKLGCGATCGDNLATASLSSCAVMGVPVRYFVYVNGYRTKTYDVRAGSCGGRATDVKDGDVVRAKACVLNKVGGSCVTKRTTVGKLRHVLVPGTVNLQLNGNFGDPNASVYDATFTIPSGRVYYTVQLVRSDGVRVPFTTAAGTYKVLKLGNGGTLSAQYTTSPTESYNFVLKAYENSTYTIRSTCDPALAISLL